MNAKITFDNARYRLDVDSSTAFAEYAVIFDALIHEYESERTTADG